MIVKHKHETSQHELILQSLSSLNHHLSLLIVLYLGDVLQISLSILYVNLLTSSFVGPYFDNRGM